MSRSRGAFHVIAFLMATMLAWPWNMTLTAVEASRSAEPPGASALVARGAGSRAQRVGRFGKWGTASSPAVSPDFGEDEAEGDDAGPYHPLATLALAASTGPATLHAAHAGMPARLQIPSPPAYLCRLRC